MISVPAQKNAAAIAACRGEPKDYLSVFSRAHQLPSKQSCSALVSGDQCFWTRMTPIGVDRAVELLERRIWDRRARGLLASAFCYETEDCNYQQRYLKLNHNTYQWDMIRTFLRFVFLAGGWRFIGLLICLILLARRAVLGLRFVRKRKSRV